MFDALLFNQKLAQEHSTAVADLNLEPRKYHLATVHRAENTDDADRLKQILSAFDQLNLPVVLPLHPRTAACIERHGFEVPTNMRTIPPADYLDMLQLVSNSKYVFTDSGGLQKEAYWLGRGCITLRDETEWTELVDVGWNRIVGANCDRILECERTGFTDVDSQDTNLYGDGQAARSIVKTLVDSV